MEHNNNATRLRREVLIRVARAAYEDALRTEADRIPYRMRPRGSDSTRCCIYKDRAVLRYRCIAAMGFAIEEEDDDAVPLADYAAAAAERAGPEGPIMTVLDVACKGCVPSRYLITDACQGCVARPCEVNCPFDAIRVEGGRARIDAETCRNCGKCREVCPYRAVVRVPIPCEEACPVGAIRKDEAGRADIDFDACISCGKCMRACPFGAVMEKSQIVDVIGALRGDAPLVAMVAPAIAGQFPGDIDQIAEALQRLGFDAVVEVATGADTTTRHEAAEFVERMGAGAPFMTTSCCPAYVEAVRKHLPALAQYVSETPTPMHYTAAAVRAERPDAVTVFIGPCVAKRHEGLLDPEVDYVLTFEEVGAMLVAREIEVAVLEGVALETFSSAHGRGFAVTGGVAGAVAALCDEETAPQAACINGLTPEAIETLRRYARGACPGTLVEVMACEGGCVGGAGVVGSVQATRRAVEAWRDAGRPLEAGQPSPKTVEQGAAS
jgi:[FeFe] hydrogenase (group B1/B3)